MEDSELSRNDKRFLYSPLTDSQSNLPFLVTHWLAGYEPSTIPSLQHNDREVSEAVKTIRRIAGELACAFSSLGEFGSKHFDNLGYLTPSVEPASILSKSTINKTKNNNHGHSNRTPHNQFSYTDLKRMWSSCCPSNHLKHLVESSQSAGITSITQLQASSMRLDNEEIISITTNLQMAARENFTSSFNNRGNGRMLHDTIEDKGMHDSMTLSSRISSLHRPVYLFNPSECIVGSNTLNVARFLMSSQALVTKKDIDLSSIPSSHRNVVNEAASNVRNYLDLKQKCQEDEAHIQIIQRSLHYNESMLSVLTQKRVDLLMQQSQEALSFDYVNKPDQITQELDEVDFGEQNCKRVIAQLKRQLCPLDEALSDKKQEMQLAREKSFQSFRQSQLFSSRFHDPVSLSNYGKERFSSNRIFFNVQIRSLGYADRYNGQTIIRSMGRNRSKGEMLENYRSLLYNRFSYAATINSHLHYPVYCLRFDRSGKYFVTGGDDYLVRVFCFGENVIVKHRAVDSIEKIDPSTFSRGAILVCTLKGHSGVINDICVSSDNSFLATASEDGDCRVWGLIDGCPIAVLRGHNGGANMVSWSTLTPYRLVTTAADGFARCWDIREACLLRYGKVIGNRPEYQLKIEGKYIGYNDDLSKEQYPSHFGTTANNYAMSNAARTQNSNVNGTVIMNDDENTTSFGVTLPALAQGTISNVDIIHNRRNISDDVNNSSTENDSDDDVQDDGQPGRFIANDRIDDGVVLLSKLCHGSSFDEDSDAPRTRSRRGAVKVICVARCPYGGHFATGSDDGVCRIWKDDDDMLVDVIDATFVGRSTPNRSNPHDTDGKNDRLLLALTGHVSAITDLVYSSAGDRILTASQKDGVVRIWSWSEDPCNSWKAHKEASPKRGNPGGTISQIHIKLTNPHSLPGQRQNRAQRQNISCDVATWVQDDTKVITSQSELVKPNGSEIVPGSHYLFLWDSVTANCLIGISGAHSMQCPILVAHPSDPSIFCSAGADGVVKLWDWETGKCFYSHTNKAELGPVEACDRGKNFGFLDGSFSPDGTVLVLTDDSGRVSVFDCKLSNKNYLTERRSFECPNWMREQYFSNDYYDVSYDETGYCVERNSGQPPHLAPRGCRCSHNGTPFQEIVTDSFSSLVGPTPFTETIARWYREETRSKSNTMTNRIICSGANYVTQYDPNRTIMIHDGTSKSNFVNAHNNSSYVQANSTHILPDERRNASVSGRVRMLSDNWRWGDAYADDLRAGDDDPEIDSDDEDFQLNDNRTSETIHTPSTVNGDDVTSLASIDRDVVNTRRRRQSGTRSRSVVMNVHRNRRSAARSRSSVNAHRRHQAVIRVSTATPSRMSSRRRRRLYEDCESDESELEEFMSTNNHPSGPFREDYETYFFKLPAKQHPISRTWVRRHESISSYDGTKKYTPQVGDIVIYIPRAHYDLIQQFPLLNAPWQSWPGDVVWPVVECSVRNIRYRFPFKDARLRQHCKSIVALVTLEVIGEPELCAGRIYPWPTPTFRRPSEHVVFEVSIFENNESDFIIPSGLYSTRVKQLEVAGKFLGTEQVTIDIESFFATGEDEDDAKLEPSRGIIIDLSDEVTENDNPCLNGSGYGSLKVVLEGQENETTHLLHPWEVIVKSNTKSFIVPKPKLDADSRSNALNAIEEVKHIDVMEHFLHPVDENRYSDYALRVELPMDLSFIIERLHSDYYSSKYSVVADMRLIRDNCINYNGELDTLSELSIRMFETFQSIMLSAEEIKWFQEYEKSIPVLHPVRRRQQRSTNNERRLESRSQLPENDRQHFPRRNQVSVPRSERPRSSRVSLGRPNHRPSTATSSQSSGLRIRISRHGFTQLPIEENRSISSQTDCQAQTLPNDEAMVSKVEKEPHPRNSSVALTTNSNFEEQADVILPSSPCPSGKVISPTSKSLVQNSFQSTSSSSPQILSTVSNGVDACAPVEQTRYPPLSSEKSFQNRLFSNESLADLDSGIVEDEHLMETETKPLIVTSNSPNQHSRRVRRERDHNPSSTIQKPVTRVTGRKTDSDRNSVAKGHDEKAPLGGINFNGAISGYFDEEDDFIEAGQSNTSGQRRVNQPHRRYKVKDYVLNQSEKKAVKGNGDNNDDSGSSNEEDSNRSNEDYSGSNIEETSESSNEESNESSKEKDIESSMSEYEHKRTLSLRLRTTRNGTLISRETKSTKKNAISSLSTNLLQKSFPSSCLENTTRSLRSVSKCRKRDANTLEDLNHKETTASNLKDANGTVNQRHRTSFGTKSRKKKSHEIPDRPSRISTRSRRATTYKSDVDSVEASTTFYTSRKCRANNQNRQDLLPPQVKSDAVEGRPTKKHYRDRNMDEDFSSNEENSDSSKDEDCDSNTEDILRSNQVKDCIWNKEDDSDSLITGQETQAKLRQRRNEKKNGRVDPPTVSKKRSANIKRSISYPARKRRATATKSYNVPDSDEYDSSGSSDASIDSSDSNSKQQSKMVPKSNKNLCFPKTVEKSFSQKKISNGKSDNLNLPILDKWPEIKARMISQVAKAIVSRLRNIDSEDVFYNPVIESYPQDADNYLSVIRHPMDFRTILNERLSKYESINELRGDLVLMCTNCIRYTGVESNFSITARRILNAMYPIFKRVCEDHFVRID